MRDFDPTASEFISTGYLTHSRPGFGVRYHDPISAIIAAVGPELLGGVAADAVGGAVAADVVGGVAADALGGAAADAFGGAAADAFGGAAADAFGGAAADAFGGAATDALGGAALDAGAYGGAAGAAGDFGMGTYGAGVGADAGYGSLGMASGGAEGGIAGNTLGGSVAAGSGAEGGGMLGSAGYGGGGFASSDGAFNAAVGGNSGVGAYGTNAAADAGYGGAGYAGSNSAFNSAMGGAAGGGGGFGSLSNLLSAGSLAQGLGTIGSGLLSANGAQRAAQTMAQAGNNTVAMRQGMFNQSQGNLAPYMQGGNAAMSSLNGKLANGTLGGNFTGDDYLANKDPGYQFQLDQGNQALQNSQAARDGVLSGASMKGMVNYNQGMASTGYQNAYDRWLSSQKNTFGQLQNTAQIGAYAATGGATNANNFSNSIGGTMNDVGNVQGSGIVGQSNAYSKVASGIGGQMYALRDMMGNGNAQDFYGQNNSAGSENQPTRSA